MSQEKKREKKGKEGRQDTQREPISKPVSKKTRNYSRLLLTILFSSPPLSGTPRLQLVPSRLVPGRFVFLELKI